MERSLGEVYRGNLLQVDLEVPLFNQRVQLCPVTIELEGYWMASLSR